MTELDQTHDPQINSWLEDANGHPDFPVQNLPIGIFRKSGSDRSCAGIAIGNHVVDIAAVFAAGLVQGEAAALAASDSTLNRYLALPPGERTQLRHQIFKLLTEADTQSAQLRAMLVPADQCEMQLPAGIGDYTDFYVGIHHATAVGKLFRPDNPLLPNYKHVPIGYHGRASSIRQSGVPVRRPNGQTAPTAEGMPLFGPSQRLDYELEMGVWIAGGNALGDTIAIGDAPAHVGGFSLLNDWSARDLQTWEYQPLGPFLAKSFASTVSPWIISPDALAPFRIAQPPRLADDPHPLPYLWDDNDQANGAFDIEMEVLLRSAPMREANLPATSLATSNMRHMYWTVAQMIAHHTSNGCNLRPGDLLGTGTLSGPDDSSCGSLLELVGGDKGPITLPSGERRMFLEDGDEIIMRARARRKGFASIGFGECRAVILPAP